MANLTFVDTHNMVVFLSKSDASACFDQIVDFLTLMSFTEVDEDDVEVPNAPTPPSPKTTPLPPPQDSITTPSQAQPAPPSSPPQEQPTDTSESSMTLLNTLMETCATLEEEEIKVFCFKEIEKGAQLKQDKIARALEIIKLKKRVKKLEKKRRSNAVEPTVFDDEEVTMTMAQKLIKMKAEKARLFDEKMAKRLHDEEVEQAAARENQEKDDLAKAKVLQQEYVDKQEYIDWNAVAEQMQEKHLDNIRKYQSLKRKLISIAQARKNMIVYLKNMAGYKMEHFRGMTYDKESFKKLKAVEVSGSHSTQDTITNDPKEMSEKDVKNMLEIVLVSEFKVEALQVKYPLIDCEIHFEGSRSYWKMIRVGGITKAY
nr:hypothetical protein [Tanacetum cinerariifolium]